MKIGIIGFNQTGKTSLFELLTGKDTASFTKSGKSISNIGTATVPDERVDFLSSVFKPKKTVYAKLELTDVPGFSISTNGESSGAARFLNEARHSDALIHVLRAFESDSVIHDLEAVNPARDFEALESEMLFADLEMIEKRISRIKSGKKIAKEQAEEISLLERCFTHLENGGAIRTMELSQSERLSVRGFSFLTEKPRLAIVNLDENQWISRSYTGKEKLLSLINLNQNSTTPTKTNSPLSSLLSPLIELCVAMELEIDKLAEDDKQLFIADLGITEPGISVLAKAAYSLLEQISFLTYGEDEVRAWTIPNGITAKAAAGKIHTDIQRGFIRAEVIKYDDFRELGTIAKVKEKGLFRLEGKDYRVADGDIITFRFNV